MERVSDPRRSSIFKASSNQLLDLTAEVMGGINDQLLNDAGSAIIHILQIKFQANKLHRRVEYAKHDSRADTVN